MNDQEFLDKAMIAAMQGIVSSEFQCDACDALHEIVVKDKPEATIQEIIGLTAHSYAVGLLEVRNKLIQSQNDVDLGKD